MPELIMFYGSECVHCHRMFPLIDKIEDELKAKVKRLEVWHNSENRNKMDEVNTMKCTGVPFFYNSKTKKGICGAVPYSVLKKWAKGK